MEGIKCVLLDIEGTICPISFVKDTLFPYALKALPDVLKDKWDSEDFKPYRDAFPEEAKASPEALRAHVEDLTKRDVKVAYHKNLQGHLWEHGYESGEYATPLFADVVPKLKEWNEAGRGLAIYSSGSVFAQQLLFGHVRSTPIPGDGRKRRREDVKDGEDGEPPAKQRETANGGKKPATSDVIKSDEAGPGEDKSDVDVNEEAADKVSVTEDLQYLITDWFDTTNAGLKTEASSYTKIADAIEMRPREVLFLSDNVKEIDAALEAGMEAILVDRPGNAPVPDTDRARLDVVESLDEVDLAGEANGLEATSQSPDVGTSADSALEDSNDQ